MATQVWRSGDQTTITQLLERRLASDPDGRYLDVCGEEVTAAEIRRSSASIANALAEMGVAKGDRVASLIENTIEAAQVWWGIVHRGAIAVPINTAYKGEYLRHQIADSGAKVVVVTSELLDRVTAIVDRLDGLTHVVVIGDERPSLAGCSVLGWSDLIGADDTYHPVDIAPDDLGTFIYTGGTTGPSKGCMLPHNYHEAITRQIGISWQRTADDVVWTPLPLFHFNAVSVALMGPLVDGGRSAIYRRFSVSNFWPEMNRTGATITSTLGTMAYLLAHDADRPEMPKSGAPEANTSLRLIGAAPLPPEVDDILKGRFGVETFSAAYGVTEASLISWQPPGGRNKPNAAGVINDEYFDVRIFDDADNEVPRGERGEIVIRPKRPEVMFAGYWGRPEATVSTSRNWWYHTGDIGIIDDEDFLFFVDRKADYLRRRGENISSVEVESILMGHGRIADVAVHAVPSPLTEDDLKITVTLEEGAEMSHEELYRFCIDELPYFALPRYIEFRESLPRSPVGRVLKRELRDEGVTASTWDAETSGITFEKR